MLDPRLLRTDLDNTARLLARRGYQLDTDSFLALEEWRKAVQVRTQELQAERLSLIHISEPTRLC